MGFVESSIASASIDGDCHLVDAEYAPATRDANKIFITAIPRIQNTASFTYSMKRVIFKKNQLLKTNTVPAVSLAIKHDLIM